MYKLNLYREYFDNRRSARDRTWRLWFLTAVIGVEVFVFLGSLVTSGMILGDRADRMRSDIRHLSLAAQNGRSLDRPIDACRALVKTREERTDWSPKLAAIAQQIDPSLTLTELSAKMAKKFQPRQLSMEGLTRNGTGEMAPVTRLIDRLRGDYRIADDLPQIQLGTIEGGGSNKFQVSCDAPLKEKS